MLTIAVDGYSSSGKGVVCTKLAQKLNIVHFDTGAIYRTIGLYVYNNNINPLNENEVVENLTNIKIDLNHNNGKQITILNGVDVSLDIRKSEISDICSITSPYPKVREFVVSIQRDSANKFDLIMEGRDITSKVLPDAQFRFFLDADIDVRANRRFNDLIKNGEKITFDEVKKDLIERDRRDVERENSPLKLMEGVVYIDNSNMTIEEEVDYMYRIIHGGNA